MELVNKINVLFKIDILLVLANLLEALVIFICFYILSIVFKKVTTKIFLDRVDNDSIITLISNTMKNIIIISGVITSISSLGIDISALVTGLGLTGFAMGFAFKDSLSNIISGVLILLYQPFNVHDCIAVDGIEGGVESIDLRYTTIKKDNKTHLIPNSTLFNKSITIINKSRTDT